MTSTRSHALAHLESTQRNENPLAFQFLDQYRELTTKLFRDITARLHPRSLSILSRPNHSKADSAFLHRLMSDSTITIKPADKNLGMALVDTEWYNCELQRMLGDTVTYQRFRPRPSNKRGGAPITFQQHQTALFKELATLSNTHQTALERWNPEMAKAVLKHLNHAVTPSNCAVPIIYLLIKVHKASGLCGRPIVPSTHWLTTPPSVVVDHLLQEIMHEAAIQHIVKDTKSFVIELESTVLSTRDGVFVTADIASLYTNIDTDMGLQLVEKFLIERGVESSHRQLIMALLSFVMKNSYLRFHDTIYRQIDGTAMGTACAPIYANIVVYMLEKKVITVMRSELHLYRRFLDDIFAYCDHHAVTAFMHRMNSLHPKLRFDFVSHPTEAAFLDLHIHKGNRFHASGVFDLRVHQKKMNLYLYIPFHSFHTDDAKRSFIQTELMRYIRNSSDRTDYVQLKQTFYQRLRDRGYPATFLLPIFDNIHYVDRKYFLYSAEEFLQSSTLLTQPPRSHCLLRRLERHRRAQCQLLTASPPCPPPVFVIPYSPLSRLVATKTVLRHHWPLVQIAIPALSHAPGPIVAYQSEPSLQRKLVFQRSRMIESERATSSALGADSVPVKVKQVTMRTYLCHPTSSTPSTHPIVQPDPHPDPVPASSAI